MSHTEAQPSDRQAVLALFEKHRACPGAPFDESHFLDFLLAQPKSRGAVHSSFFGLRRYNAFIEEIQLHFSVCLSVKDFEATYSLDEFLQRIGEVKRSIKSSLASFRNQQKRGFGWGTISLANFVCLFAFSTAARYSYVVAIVVGIFWGVLNAVATSFYFRWRAYQKRLQAQLQAVAAHDI